MMPVVAKERAHVESSLFAALTTLRITSCRRYAGNRESQAKTQLPAHRVISPEARAASITMKKESGSARGSALAAVSNPSEEVLEQNSIIR